MRLQECWTRRRIVTLAALMKLPLMNFHMTLQSCCSRIHKTTLFTFVFHSIFHQNGFQNLDLVQTIFNYRLLLLSPLSLGICRHHLWVKQSGDYIHPIENNKKAKVSILCFHKYQNIFSVSSDVKPLKLEILCF